MGQIILFHYLLEKDINQFFIDTTCKCLPNELEEIKIFLVLIGYNAKKDLFEMILVGILSFEDSDIFSTLYKFLKNTYKWIPKYLKFNFGGSNIKAVKDVFTNKEDITIITCLFYLIQGWRRKAGNLGLRKRKYINNTKLMLFNMELL